eukprot:4875818-Pyramimonas_sp.AAC.1
MPRPALEEHVAAELHGGVVVARERRKLREHWELARSSPVLVPSQAAAAAVLVGADPLRSLTGAPANP